MWNSRFDKENACEYATIANEIFAPIFPVIAERIVKRCGVTDGTAIDLGTGPGNLAIALARITDLRLYAMDFAPHILDFAMQNVRHAGLNTQVVPLAGDVHHMPFDDNIASLVVSRGSMRFWRDKPSAFREIKRILKPGGKGFVGGGLGSAALGDAIDQEISRRGFRWQIPPRQTKRKNTPVWRKILEKTCFHFFEIMEDDSGFWIYFEKE
jgi:ubiquinone/menaquinone biosynthesis C-methylase UbiE